MIPLRQIRLTGGQDARNLRVVDMETGELVPGVVKIELLCTPDGALVNVTQACRLAAIDVEALNLGVPLIDLPDDHPEVLAAEATRAAIDAAMAPPAAPAGKTAREAALEAAGVIPRVVELPPVKPRKRRTIAELADELADELRQPPADPAPPPLPAAPSEKARRAPPPEEVRTKEDPDQTPEEKAELAKLLEQAAPPRTTLAPGAKWPFPSASERRAAAGLPTGGDDV